MEGGARDPVGAMPSRQCHPPRSPAAPACQHRCTNTSHLCWWALRSPASTEPFVLAGTSPVALVTFVLAGANSTRQHANFDVPAQIISGVVIDKPPGKLSLAANRQGRPAKYREPRKHDFLRCRLPRIISLTVWLPSKLKITNTSYLSAGALASCAYL